MKHTLMATLFASCLIMPMAAAIGDDAEILPPGGVEIRINRVDAVPPYRAELGDDGKPVLLTRTQIVAELREITGLALNDQGGELLPPPFPRVFCRFETYSVVNHRWFESLIHWCTGQVRFLGLTYRRENWDCDDYSMAYNAIADIAQLRAQTPAPPRLVGRLIVQQKVAWAGTPVTGAHEVITFRSGKSWWVCEPQNGTKILLKNYPNREHVREIMFN